MSSATKALQPSSITYYEEELDLRRYQRWAMWAMLACVPIGPLLDLLGYLIFGDPIDAWFWLPLMPVEVAAAIILPRFLVQPHPGIEVGESTVDYRVFRFINRPIPLHEFRDMEPRTVHGRTRLQVNGGKWRGGFHLETARPYELMDAIERARRSEMNALANDAKAEMPGFRSDARFEIRRRLSIREALVSKRMIGFLLILLVSIGGTVADGSLPTLFELAFGGVLLIFGVGALTLRRKYVITIDERELRFNGGLSRSISIPTNSIVGVSTIDSFRSGTWVLVRKSEPKSREYRISFPEPEEAAATIRRAIAFFKT